MKTDKTPKTAKVFHFDLYGKREDKYDFLNNNSLQSIQWNQLAPNAPNFFLVKKDFDESGMYEKGFAVNKIFKEFASGLTTERDGITIQFDIKDIETIISDFGSLDIEFLRNKYDKKPDGRDWKYNYAQNDIISNKGKYIDISYRPFDIRKTYYTGKSKGFMAYPRNEVMKHLISKENLGLITKRGFDNEKSAYCFITNCLFDRRGWSSPGMQGAENVFPLYLYPDLKTQQSIDQTTERTPNLNKEIVQKIAVTLGLEYDQNPTDIYRSGKDILLNLTKDKPGASVPKKNHSLLLPIDILDYIYAVLHSPAYREKYKEFLKIDFPRVPYPKDQSTFWKLVKLGGEIRKLHLLESSLVEDYITEYPIDGDNIVGKVKYQDGKVFINDSQYFDNVPQVAWEFYIGGYQPAQKWLKDRKGRKLEFDDIFHYQKMIVALVETERLMREIDVVGVE
ncbi:MAG: hypothetical protein IPM69_11790 [Ignavibacteria bacterium]|nr:hypothetical protein [Ignavibacteria bacterium]